MKSIYLLAVLLLFSGCLESNQPLIDTSTSTIPPFSTLPEVTTTTLPIATSTSTSTTISIVGSISSSTSSTTSTSSTETTLLSKPVGQRRLTIASWNIQRYGPTKAANTEIVKQIASRVHNYDIVILQEITDSSGAAFNKLCTYLNDYKCITSDRIGNSTYKEQYGIIYKDAELLDKKYIATNTMERTPMWLTFKSGNWTFNLVTAHTKPTNDQIEMLTLDQTLNQPAFSNDTILIGDLNADCTYYTPGNEFTDWLWAIKDGSDTTVGHTQCTYDRLIINKAAQNNYYSSGIDKTITPDISDHYLIYGIFDNSIP
jgi:deoxyribonuclease-1-like protein